MGTLTTLPGGLASLLILLPNLLWILFPPRGPRVISARGVDSAR